jgi:putative nucleotidyltransferase with HDIG domain
VVIELNGVSWSFASCPAPPDWRVDWPALLTTHPWLRALDGVPQSPIHHAEGDVLTHTGMVAQALAALPAWRALPETERALLFAAVLLHDIGKPECTRTELDGTISSRGHARAGATIARRLLWTAEGFGQAAPFAVREAIVALVRLHGLPIWFLERDEIQRAIIAASYRARLGSVALLAEADARGRICADRSELLARIDLFRETCGASGCLAAPYPFASDHGRVRYFRQRQQEPQYHPYDDTWGEVLLLAGLPGAGKDTWLQGRSPDLPVISLDAIRAAQRIAPEAPQGAVADAAKQQARVFLRARQPFVWNATNLTRLLRDPLIDLFLGYGARVRIVYHDAPIETLLRRNRARTAPVPEQVIRRLAGKLDLPDLTEAHQVDYVIESQ